MDLESFILRLLMAVLGGVGFSILFYIKPRRLPFAALGALITCGTYLLAQHFWGGEFIPNLAGAFLGGIYSEIMARACKAPVPVYLVPCAITLVPGGLLYKTMNQLIGGSLTAAVQYGLTALSVGAGIAGGIMAASVLGMLFNRAGHRIRRKNPH